VNDEYYPVLIQLLCFAYLVLGIYIGNAKALESAEKLIKEDAS